MVDRVALILVLAVLSMSGGVILAADCNHNEVEDSTDIAGGTSADCNQNSVPDECDLRSTWAFEGTPLVDQPDVNESSVAAADFDGDGDLDLAVVFFDTGAGGTNGRVGLYWNDAHGSFTPGMQISRPKAISALAADLDADGHPDLVVVAARDLVVYYNDGMGSFQTSVVIEGNTGELLYPYAGDLDGDGDLDLAVSMNSYRPCPDFCPPCCNLFGFVFLPNDGQGGFPKMVTLVGDLKVRALVLADLDGQPPLEVVSSHTTGLAFHRYATDELFDQVGGLDLSGSENHDVLVLPSDLDADGDTDLVVERNVFMNIGGLQFAPPVPLPFSPGAAGSLQHMAVADFNGDLALDVARHLHPGLGSAQSPGSLWVHQNRGDGAFEAPTGSFSTPGGLEYLWVRPAITGDFDGDSDIDLVWGNLQYGPAALILNSSLPSTSTDANGNSVPDECESTQHPGDCNQDGKLDISDAICLLGHLFIGAPAVVPCGDGTITDAATVSLLDANGDGMVDLSDPVRMLGFLFGGSGPPVLGTECQAIAGCPDNSINCGP